MSDPNNVPLTVFASGPSTPNKVGYEFHNYERLQYETNERLDAPDLEKSLKESKCFLRVRFCF